MVVFFAFLLHVCAVASQRKPVSNPPDPRWNFSGDRQPTYRQLLNDGLYFSVNDCRKTVDALYEAYADLHPGFHAVMNETGMRRRWRMSLVVHQLVHRPVDFEIANSCFYEQMTDRLLEASEARGPAKIIYCGRFIDKLLARDARTVLELEEYTTYAFAGSQLMILSMLRRDFHSTMLNQDVRYYLQRLYLEIANGDAPSLKLGAERLETDESSMLSPERRRFVEEAARRRDHEAVLNTTEPCDFPPELPIDKSLGERI